MHKSGQEKYVGIVYIMPMREVVEAYHSYKSRENMKKC